MMKMLSLFYILALAIALPLAAISCSKQDAAESADVAAKADHVYAVAMTGVV